MVSPPKRVHVEIEDLESASMRYFVSEPTPDDLDVLATAVYIEDVSEIDLDEVEVRPDVIDLYAGLEVI